MSTELSNSPATVWINHERQPAEAKRSAALASETVNKAQRSTSWHGLQLSLSTEDISKPTIWRIREHRHAVVVHLGGTIHQLETELAGCGARLDRPPMIGEAWMISAGQNYASHAKGNVVDYAEVYIDPDFLVELLGHRAEIGEIRPCAGHYDEFLYRSVQYLAELMSQKDDLSQMTCLALSQALCLHVLRKYCSQERGNSANPRMPRLNPKKVQMLEEYVHAHLGDHIRLDALSALAGMSLHQLLRAFRASFGTTPTQYVIEQRLRRVRWLLSNTREDITSIAIAAGFASHSHLTTTFKEHIGLTPHEFRTSKHG